MVTLCGLCALCYENPPHPPLWSMDRNSTGGRAGVGEGFHSTWCLSHRHADCGGMFGFMHSKSQRGKEEVGWSWG